MRAQLRVFQVRASTNRAEVTVGTITLWRYPYRYWHRDTAEACLFPLETVLGLVHGATPALAEAVGRYMAQAGATQQAAAPCLTLPSTKPLKRAHYADYTPQEFGGLCNLRFDDTNPCTEEVEYVDSIMEDVRWLGFDWPDRLFYASDYFEQIYQWAVQLITYGRL